MRDAPPSVRDAPPSVRDAPPSVRDAPPSVRDAPPSVRDAPLSVRDVPPAPASVRDAPPAPPSVVEETVRVRASESGELLQTEIEGGGAVLVLQLLGSVHERDVHDPALARIAGHRRSRHAVPDAPVVDGQIPRLGLERVFVRVRVDIHE